MCSSFLRKDWRLPASVVYTDNFFLLSNDSTLSYEVQLNFTPHKHKQIEYGIYKMLFESLKDKREKDFKK